MKRNWQLLVLTAIIQTLILLVLFRSGIYHNASLQHDVSVFYNYSSRIVSGQLPYQDFTVEYPPVAFVFFILPRLVASSLGAYQLAFAVEILIFDLIGLVLLYRLSQNLKFRPPVTLAIYTVLLLGIGPIIIYRYDLIPAVMVLACLYAFSQNKYKLSWAILAVAMMTKIYPAVIAPVLLLYQLSHRRYREAGWSIAMFIVSTAIIVIPGLLISPSGFWNSFSIQMQRGLHAESLYASFLLLGQTLGLTKVAIQIVGPTPLSVNVVSPLANLLARIAPVIMVSVLLTIYWLFYRRIRKNSVPLSPGSHPDMANIVNYSFLAILVFLLTNSVFSPQFLIWLFPLVPLVSLLWRHIPWLTFTLVSILTYYLYPMHYNSFMQEDAHMIYVLLSRNLLLVALLVLSAGGRQPMAVAQNQSSPRLVFKPYFLAAALIVALGSVVLMQMASNLNMLPNDLNNAPGIPAFRPDNGFPGGPPPGGTLPNFPGGNPVNSGDGHFPRNAPGKGFQLP